MMTRADGVRIPIGFIPNGSGNTVCYMLGIESVDEALDTVVAATVSKFDVTRVLGDAEKDSDIPSGRTGFA